MLDKIEGQIEYMKTQVRKEMLVGYLNLVRSEGEYLSGADFIRVVRQVMTEGITSKVYRVFGISSTAYYNILGRIRDNVTRKSKWRKAA